MLFVFVFFVLLRDDRATWNWYFSYFVPARPDVLLLHPNGKKEVIVPLPHPS